MATLFLAEFIGLVHLGWDDVLRRHTDAALYVDAIWTSAELLARDWMAVAEVAVPAGVFLYKPELVLRLGIQGLVFLLLALFVIDYASPRVVPYLAALSQTPVIAPKGRPAAPETARVHPDSADLCDRLAGDTDDPRRYDIGAFIVGRIVEPLKAIDACRRATSVTSADTPRLLDQLGRALEAAGNAAEACAAYESSAKGGYAPGMTRYAKCLLRRDEDGAAVQWFTQAIEGSVFAKYKMAEFLCNGFPQGGIAVSSANRKKAVQLMQRALDEGYPLARGHPALTCDL